jgi:hypothetical protein
MPDSGTLTLPRGQPPKKLFFFSRPVAYTIKGRVGSRRSVSAVGVAHGCATHNHPLTYCAVGYQECVG